MHSEQNIFLENDYFTVNLTTSHTIPGYCILLAKNNITSIVEMSEQQLLQFGQILKMAEQEILAQVQAEKIYRLSFCEVLATFHMHLFPRTKALLAEFRQACQLSETTDVNGALLFDWARAKYQR